jgi:HK97 family phage portal protein
VKSLRSLVARAPVPLAAAAGRALAGRGGGQGGDKVAQMQMMGAVGTLFGIVHKTSTGTAKVEWELVRRRSRNPNKGEPVPVEKHAAIDLWDRPNPFTSRQGFVEIFQQHLDLTGEAWWVIGRDPRSSLPLELWPIRPDRMAPVPDPYEFISGYVYRAPDGNLIPLGVDEVIQLKMPDPLDPYRGLGPVQASMRIADSQRFGVEWNRNFFINSAEPGGFVVFKKTLSEPEFKRWQERWREQHQGVAAAHRVGVLENAEWVERKMTQRDMQFEQLVNTSRDMIREAFTIHKASLGLADDVNRANAVAARILFAEDILTPRLDRIAGALNEKLLPLFDADPQLKFCYQNPAKDEESERLAQQANVDMALALINAGADWDETLQAFGLPALPRDEPEPAPAQLAPVMPLPPGEDDDEEEEPAEPAARLRIRARMPRPRALPPAL